MFSVITRFLILIVLAFVAGLIALSNFGPTLGIAAGITVLAIPLIYSYINLAHLLKYTVDDSIETMPLPSGYFEDALSRLQRLVRNLKQRILSVEKQHNRFIEAFQASPKCQLKPRLVPSWPWFYLTEP